MATTTLRADSAHVTPAPTIPALTDLKINGVSPFWSHRDGVDERLAEAHAILTMLADRHDMIGEDAEGGDSRATRSGSHRGELNNVRFVGGGQHRGNMIGPRLQREVLFRPPIVPLVNPGHT